MLSSQLFLSLAAKVIHLKYLPEKCHSSTQNPLMILHLTQRSNQSSHNGLCDDTSSGSLLTTQTSSVLLPPLLSLYKPKWPAMLPLACQRCSGFISSHLLFLLVGTVYPKMAAWFTPFSLLILAHISLSYWGPTEHSIRTLFHSSQQRCSFFIFLHPPGRLHK